MLSPKAGGDSSADVPRPLPQDQNGSPDNESPDNVDRPQARETPSFRSHTLSSTGSSRTIYFEFQRLKKAANDDESEVEITFIDRMKSNWAVIAVIVFLLIITLVCAIIEVNLVSSQI
jgi:hypothetical protein